MSTSKTNYIMSDLARHKLDETKPGELEKWNIRLEDALKASGAKMAAYPPADIQSAHGEGLAYCKFKVASECETVLDFFEDDDLSKKITKKMYGETIKVSYKVVKKFREMKEKAVQIIHGSVSPYILDEMLKAKTDDPVKLIAVAKSSVIKTTPAKLLLLQNIYNNTYWKNERLSFSAFTVDQEKQLRVLHNQGSPDLGLKHRARVIMQKVHVSHHMNFAGTVGMWIDSGDASNQDEASVYKYVVDTMGAHIDNYNMVHKIVPTDSANPTAKEHAHHAGDKRARESGYGEYELNGRPNNIPRKEATKCTNCWQPFHNADTCHMKARGKKKCQTCRWTVRLTGQDCKCEKKKGHLDRKLQEKCCKWRWLQWRWLWWSWP